ncbi:MAG: hypothetical protein Q8O67_22910 [Deltaproteobacteria bacterium]|nr:hypothetical protein [Deltaproteobacteria bacterium]
MTRIAGGGLSRNPFGATAAHTKEARPAETLGQQVEEELFGKKRKRPTLVDDDSVEMQGLLARLSAWKDKLARFAGDREADYRLQLCEGTIAMIDAGGDILLGRKFLLAHRDDTPLLVGVIAHEIGHRPARWSSLKAEQPRTRVELQELCRLEETRADHFAGRALAAFGLSPSSLCTFLLALEDPKAQGSHDYFPAPLRVEVIVEGHADGQRKGNARKSLFPELDRHTNPRNDLGSG